MGPLGGSTEECAVMKAVKLELTEEMAEARGKSDLYATWRACPRGDWLLWIAGTLGVDRKLVVRAACACARLALQYVPAARPRALQAIEAAEKWAEGRATLSEVRAAYAAAYAADAADAAYAAYAADAAADADAADARRAMQLNCAREVRSVIPWRVVRDALRASEDTAGIWQQIHDRCSITRCSNDE